MLSEPKTEKGVRNRACARRATLRGARLASRRRRRDTRWTLRIVRRLRDMGRLVAIAQWALGALRHRGSYRQHRARAADGRRPDRADILDPSPTKHHSSRWGSAVKTHQDSWWEALHEESSPKTTKNYNSYNSSIVNKTTAVVDTHHSALIHH